MTATADRKAGFSLPPSPTTEMANFVRSGKRWPAKTSKTKCAGTPPTARARPAPTAPPHTFTIGARGSIAWPTRARAPARRCSPLQHAEHDNGRAARERQREDNEVTQKLAARRLKMPTPVAAERRRRGEWHARLRSESRAAASSWRAAVAADGASIVRRKRRTRGHGLVAEPRRRSRPRPTRPIRMAPLGGPPRASARR